MQNEADVHVGERPFRATTPPTHGSPRSATSTRVDDAFYDVLARTERRHWWYSARREILAWAVASALESAPREGVLYDLGCGVGANLPMLAGFGTAVGVDTSEKALAYCRARTGALALRADLEKLTAIETDTARLVLLADVLEHLDDDESCLDAIRDLCKPEAALVITVPAFQALWGVNDLASQHRRRYTARTLTAVLAPRFAIERMTYFNSWLLPAIALSRWSERLRTPRPGAEGEVPPLFVNAALRGVLRSELTWLRRGRSFGAGVSLLAIARKRLCGVPARRLDASVGEACA